MIIAPITTINLQDGAAIAVSDLPAELQPLIAYYNHFRQKEADINADLLMAQAAVKDVTRELSVGVQKWLDSKKTPSEPVVESAPQLNTEAQAP